MRPSTNIALRSITYANLRYVIIHPAVRARALNISGLMDFEDVRTSAEFRENLQGRAARTSRGLASFLFDFETFTYMYYKNHSMSPKEGKSEPEGSMWDVSADSSSSSGWVEVLLPKKRRVDIFGI